MDKMYDMEISSKPDEDHSDPLFNPQMQNPAQNSVLDVIRMRPTALTLEEWIEFIGDHPMFKEFDDFLERLLPQDQTERIELYGRDVSTIHC